MTPATLLGLMRLASPALPVGGYSYSEGLESAIEAGVVHDEASACDWLVDQLHLGLARADLPLLAAAHEAWSHHDAPRIAELNRWWLATRETGELRAQSEQMGRSMLEWLHKQSDAAADPRVATLAALTPTWPLAFALAAVQAGADAQGALLAYGFSWAENMVQAALKAVPLGQSAGQRMLARLAHDLPALADAALHIGDDDRLAYTPMLALRSAQHETQYSRLFRS
jgi:urease accessory protein